VKDPAHAANTAGRGAKADPTVDGPADADRPTPTYRDPDDDAEGAGADPRARSSRAAERTLKILELLAEADEGISLTRLSQRSGTPMATCSTLLATIERCGYARREIAGRKHKWHATLALYRLGAHVIAKVDTRSAAQPELERLTAETGMPSHLGALDGSNVVYISKVSAPGFFQFDTFVGRTAHFSLTALGRAIAAFLPADEIAHLTVDLPTGAGPHASPQTARTLVDLLARIRAAGFAVEDQEEIAGISCIAAPVFDATGKPVASIGVTWFAAEFDDARRETVGELVQHAARRTSTSLGFPEDKERLGGH